MPASLLTRQGTAAYLIQVSDVLTSLDPRWGWSLLNNSSKSMTCGRVGLGLTSHSCRDPSYVLVHVRQLGAMTDLRCEQQREYVISRTTAAIANPLKISNNSRMLNSARIVTPVA